MAKLKGLPCHVCGETAPPDCQLCKTCLAEVKAMQYETPMPATFQEAVELLRERKQC